MMKSYIARKLPAETRMTALILARRSAGESISPPSVANPKFASAWAMLRADFGFKATLATNMNVLPRVSRQMALPHCEIGGFDLFGESHCVEQRACQSICSQFPPQRQ